MTIKLETTLEKTTKTRKLTITDKQLDQKKKGKRNEPGNPQKHEKAKRNGERISS